jgi:succinate dehydrogenase / fumarate reductase flavoprotein subunit
LSDLLVFGKRAGEHAAEHAKGFDGTPSVDGAQIEEIARNALAPFARIDGENPYDIHHDLQETMQDLVGLIRTESELAKAVDELQTLRQRAANVRVVGGRRYNPGWHLSLDLWAMLTVSECCARAALERRESRGGHTRDDYPQTDPEFAKVNVVCRQGTDEVDISREALPVMPDDLRDLVDKEPA